MASEKNITMRQYNGVDYDTLYPKTKAEQVEGIFSKEEIVSTETLSKYGFGADGTPNGVFDLLSRFNSGLGNEYVWEKRDSTGIVGYVNSPDPNAYPPAVSDGYTYTSLGKLGERVQTIIGSYTGTGSYGYNSPNKLTFNFKPKIVFISTNASTHTERSAPYIWGDKELLYNGQTNNNASVSDNTLSWYHDKGAQQQFNISGQKYLYVAIG